MDLLKKLFSGWGRLSTDETAQQWAEKLQSKNDYRSLAAYCCAHTWQQDERVLWNTKRHYAYEALRQAGRDAVDAMLAELERGESKDYKIADILMEIGDPKAVPLLTRLLDRDVWGAMSGQNSKTKEFVDRFPQFHGGKEEIKPEVEMAKKDDHPDKIVSEPIKRCERCEEQALRQSQFLDECGKAGLLIIDGNLFGGRDDQEKVEIYRKLENQKGFRCSACLSIYCTSCLFNFAPVHASGGKACFKCKGRFERFE